MRQSRRNGIGIVGVYPIPYVNPPREIRIEFRGKRIYISCVDSLSGTEYFPPIWLESSIAFETIGFLVKEREREIRERIAPEAFSYISSGDLQKALSISDPNVRRRFFQIAIDLREAVEEGWPGATYRKDMLIENSHGKGYRLAPSVRPVSTTE
jgi:hypothetical protein